MRYGDSGNSSAVVEGESTRSAGGGSAFAAAEAERPSQMLGKGDRKPNYNDDYHLGIGDTIGKLVDTSKVIELEVIDPSQISGSIGYRFVKRLFDIASCSVATVLCAIPMAIIAVKVKLDSPGPVFYRQERVGLNGKPITVVKFRSMRVDAEANGAQWAEDDDPRVTKFGRFLRSTRLDEIPQFVTVVKGDLSLVGPRPERKVFADEFERYIHGFSQRTLVKPGITGLAQVNGGYNLLPAEKIIWDLEYVRHRSLGMDAHIIAKTFVVLTSHEGAR